MAFLLVGLSLFWAATNYAAAVGESRAREVEETFRTALPSAVVYSKDRLHLTGAGVRETECAEAEAESGYRYRYEGLHLLIRSDRQYFFLPDAWSPSGGVAVVVPEGDSVRLQLSNPAEATLLPGADGAAAC